VIIAANFKTNHTRLSTKKYLDELISVKNSNQQIRVFPPSTALMECEISDNIKIGAQNAYPVKSGSFTGEIGLEQLGEFNINTILIGHSERREKLNESQEFIAKKFEFFKNEGFEIVYCIGEPWEIREKGLEAVIEYLKDEIENIDLDYDRLIVAYEPIWAIGTGVSATIEQITETHDKLREIIKAPLLYGGSVKSETLKDILTCKNVDGVLVGTASWKVEEFLKMINIADILEGESR